MVLAFVFIFWKPSGVNIKKKPKRRNEKPVLESQELKDNERI